MGSEMCIRDRCLGNGGEPQVNPFHNLEVGDIIPAYQPDLEYWRVCKNGGTAANRFQVQQSATTSVQRTATDAAAGTARAGSNQITFAVAANYAVGHFVGGFITVLKTISSVIQPFTYPIVASSQTTDANRRLTVTVLGVITEPIDNTCVIQLISNKAENTVVGTASAADAVGVPLVNIPANQYYLAVAKGRVPIRADADYVAGANNKWVIKGANGTVSVRDAAALGALGVVPIGRVYGNWAASNTNYGRWLLVDIDTL